MVLHSARLRCRFVFSMGLSVALLGLCAAEEIEPPKPKPDDKKPAAGEKHTGPEHNVTLMEEPGVADLFARAAKARTQAEKNPEIWPDCVKWYAEILKKYPNTVYLDRWEGPDNSDKAYKNGLYKSTRERVARELAALPESALAVYRRLNEPQAKRLFLEGQEQFDERKIEQVARDYFLTSWSDDALAWLGEIACERGAWRDALLRLKQAAVHPGKLAAPIGLLTRILLAQIQIHDNAGAEKTLAALAAAMNGAQPDALRVGRDEGPAALEKLKNRVAALKLGPAEAQLPARDEAKTWETYFGDAAHVKQAQQRPEVGLRKWSVRIDDLLYGVNAVSTEPAQTTTEDGQVMTDSSINQQLTIQNNYFYINDGQVYSAYPAGNPRPGGVAAGGNALFQLPADGVKAPPRRKSPNSRNGEFAAQTQITQHPYFATLANGRAFGILGAEAPAQGMGNTRFGRIFIAGAMNEDGKPKGPSNYPVCFGRAETGKEVCLLWSLKPGDAAYNSQSKPDQEWLRSIYFATSPTYEAGVLYAMAVQIGQTLDSWACALDAETGRLLWRTQICTGHPLMYGGNGFVQPDRALPVAVANHTVYAVTNLGAVAALDASGGAIKWIRIYDRAKTRQDNMWGQGEIVASRDFWAPNPPLVYENCLIVTPQDSEFLYVYDVNSGARIWETARRESMDAQEERGLKHVLGVTHGTLVLTGADIRFMSVRFGKLAASIVPEGQIKGRGAVTDNTVLVSTEKGLLSIGMALDGKALKVAEPKLHKWAEPQNEAGSVYSAAGVLYTVSHTHVNAYIVVEEIEAKLKERLAANPDDFSARIELADVYKSIERHSEALAELDAATASAEKQKGDAKAQEALAGIGTRRFETTMALGNKAAADSRVDDALSRYRQAYELARAPGMADLFAILALKAQAELFEKKGDLAGAARAFQTIVIRHGDAVFQFEAQSAIKARLFAQARISALKTKDPASYAPIEAEAKAAFADAGSDTKKLEDVIKQYPNSDQSGAALLALARINLEDGKSADRARLNALRYLSRQRGAPATAQALAFLATACERINLLGHARETLLKLAGAEFKDARISLQGIDPKGGADIVAGEWARKRLDDPLYQRAASQSVFSLGTGKLNKKPAWTKPNPESTAPLLPEGVPPMEMRHAVFYVENQTDLVALNGRDGGELWKPRPQAPGGARARAFWWERLLLVCGEKTISAYDSADNGRMAWTLELKLDGAGTGGYWCQVADDRLVVLHSVNVLQAFDAASGGPLWRAQIAGAQLTSPPVCGNGFVAVAPDNSNKLTVYELDTGAPRFITPIDVLTTGLVVAGDLIYAAQRANKLSVFDAKSGKKFCDDISTGGAIGVLRAAGDYVFASINRKELAAFRIDPKNPKKEWFLPGEEELKTGQFSVADFYVDGDDLLVASLQSNAKTELASYSIKRQGSLNWKREMAADTNPRSGQPMVNGAVGGRIIINGRMFIQQNGGLVQLGEETPMTNVIFDNTTGWLRENVAREHILVMQSVWDLGGMAKIIALIDRKTGLSVWDADLKTELVSATGMSQPALVQLFDGGLVLFEAQTRSGYVAPGAAADENEYKELAARAQNADDIEARVKLAAADYDKGDAAAREKALDALAALLSDAKLDDAKFALVYNQFAALRVNFASASRTTLPFMRIDKEPAVNGAAAGWENVPEKTFKAWRGIYLASEDPSARALPKKDAWRGLEDLSASFKGAYDDKKLYIQIAVKDDQHNNQQLEAARIDFGDALSLAFDIGLSGGIGYRGETFELALGLAKNGKPVGCRRLEHGRYPRGQSPLEKDFSVTRDENAKLTLYQLALPLEYLGLKPEAARKFGFTFAIQDQDVGGAVEKALCPSPGLFGKRSPGLFSHGMLEAKK